MRIEGEGANKVATVSDMMREVIAYAHEEMRNRGLEEAAQYLISQNRMYADVAGIRALKRDPSKQLSDWWAERSADNTNEA